ncbi:MAG: hypothetical protein KKC46_18730 [Proteobacteria bacterium]|nr:hypothetical protein [Pseudomonadota bacterium]
MYQFSALVEEPSDRFDMEVFAYVLMSNHYYLLLKTLNAIYPRSCNDETVKSPEIAIYENLTQ